MNDLQSAVETPRRSLAVDGPPFLGVATVFVLLATVWVGSGWPSLGIAVLAIGVIATVGLDFREWRELTREDRRAAEAGLSSLPTRLQRARARQIERDRYR